MSTIPTYGPVNPYAIAADAGAFPMGAGVNPSTLQSLYAQLTSPAGAGAIGSRLPMGAAATGIESLYGSGATGGSILSRLSPSAIAAGGIEWPGLAAFARGAAPPVIASQLATAGINSALPSTGKAGDVRQVLGDAATGAGIGAAVGSIVPVAGTGVGAAAGAIGGGLYGAFDSLFGGEDKPSTDDYKNTLVDSAKQLGVDPSQYSAAWDLLTKSGADPKQLSVQLAQQLLSDAATQKQQQQAIALAAQQREVDQRFALALQSQAQEFFAPYTNNIVNAGASQAELLKGLAGQLPAPYRDIMLNQAQQSIGQSQRLAGAYAIQSALIPGQFMAQAELKRQTELQKYQYQQAVIAAQQGNGGGAQNYQQLTQQLAGQAAQPTG